MKHLSFFCFLFLFLSCNNTSTKRENPSKDISPIIVREGSFIYVQLNVRPLSRTEIYADISFSNYSDDTLEFYKLLLPLNGELKTNIFSIFDELSLEQINYTGIREGRYLKLAPDDEDGVIIPDLIANNFIIIPPQQKLSYTINLSKFYDFSKADKNVPLSLVFATYLPAVSMEFKQVYEEDSTDNKLKPLYYSLTLPNKANLDSMRVHFYIH